MINFDKYYNYIKNAFKDYPYIEVIICHQNEDLMMVRIKSTTTNKNVKGFLEIKFDQDTIAFFGDFFADEYIDEFDNSWEKYTEAEIYAFLDKKIEEYKYYIDNGYIFTYYDNENKLVMYLHDVVDNKKFDEEVCKEVYFSFGKRGKSYAIVKTVVISNFYGEVVDTIKVNE